MPIGSSRKQSQIRHGMTNENTDPNKIMLNKKSILVWMFGFPATLIHGDTLVLDRWIWLRNRLPKTRNGERLLDVGCGTGAFTIGASLRVYHALGLSWDERNQSVAAERAKLVGAKTTEFQIQDVRFLHDRNDLFGRFDCAICTETSGVRNQ